MGDAPPRPGRRKNLRKPAIQRLVYGALLTLLVTATLLLSGTQEETATPIPFVHVVIDKDARGATGPGVDCKAGGDIDGDGRPDVVVSEEVYPAIRGGSVYWFERPLDPKSATWIRHTSVIQGTTNAIDVGDMKGDGDIDIITGEHRGSRKVVVWENRDNGKSWVEHVVDTGKESHLGARVADLDGDGRLKILRICWDTYRYPHLWRRSGR